MEWLAFFRLKNIIWSLARACSSCLYRSYIEEADKQPGIWGNKLNFYWFEGHELQARASERLTAIPVFSGSGGVEKNRTFAASFTWSH
ncbi:MAG: hypothetical protein ACO1NZ_02505 [Adhaeribacter sp.]